MAAKPVRVQIPEATMHRSVCTLAARSVPLTAALAALAAGPLLTETGPASPQDDRQDSIRAIARGALLDDAVRGLSIVVLVDDEVLADVGEGVAGCDPEVAGSYTRYAAGGMLDLLLGIVTARLAERESLDPDAAVADLVEGFPFAESGITVRQLLAHTSGLPSLADLPDGALREASAASGDVEAALMERLGALPLTAEPGSCQEYSSGAVLALGLVLEAAADADLPTLIEREVVEPLRLEGTGYRDARTADDERFHRFLGSEGLESDPGPLPFDAGRLRTTADDLARLGAALGTAGWEEVHDLLAAPTVLDRQATPFGHGFVLGDLEDHAFFAFGGGSESCTAQVAHYPDLALTIAVCASSGEAPVERIERRIARQIYDLPEPGLRDLPLPPEAATLYAGEYLLGCNSYWVDAGPERLRLSVPDGLAFELLNQGRHVFVSSIDPDVRLEFVVELEGEPATGFHLFERGARSEAKRLR